MQIELRKEHASNACLPTHRRVRMSLIAPTWYCSHSQNHGAAGLERLPAHAQAGANDLERPYLVL